MTEPIIPLQFQVRPSYVYEFSGKETLMWEAVYALGSDNRIRVSYRTDNGRHFGPWRLLPFLEETQ